MRCGKQYSQSKTKRSDCDKSLSEHIWLRTWSYDCFLMELRENQAYTYGLRTWGHGQESLEQSIGIVLKYLWYIRLYKALMSKNILVKKGHHRRTQTWKDGKLKTLPIISRLEILLFAEGNGMDDAPSFSLEGRLWSRIFLWIASLS